MRVYRLCKEKYSARVLDGEGGKIIGGRWHTRGRRIVYCASSEALAVLEVRVHIGRYSPSAPYVMHGIEVPEECIATFDADALPTDWNAVPYGTPSRNVGDAWLESGRSAALRVPSVHSSTDASILLNPAHTDFASVQVVSMLPYAFDRRLFGVPLAARTRRDRRR